MANPLATELNFRRLTSRKLTDVANRPMIFNPDTAANIATYTAAQQMPGDMVYDTTNAALKVSNGTSFANAGVITDTWATLRGLAPAEGSMAWATDLNMLLSFDGTVWQPVYAPSLFRDDFIRSAYGAAVQWTLTETSTTGAPTVALIAGSSYGLEMTLANTAGGETHTARVNWGDIRPYMAGSASPQTKLIYETTVSFDTVPAAASVGIYVGLSSAGADDFQGTVANVGFALEANGNLLAISDDNTTDRSGDTGIDIVDGDVKTLRIEVVNNAACRFLVDGVDVTTAAQTSAGGAFTLAGASGVGRFLQPAYQLQKVNNAAQPSIVIRSLKIAASAPYNGA